MIPNIKKTCPRLKVDVLLADDIDQESEFGEHREYHQKMKPTMPDGYVATAEDLRDCPPMPVPPAPSAGQPASVRGSLHAGFPYISIVRAYVFKIRLLVIHIISYTHTYIQKKSV